MLLTLYGCGAIIAGGTTYVYTEGWVERDYDIGIDEACKAGLQAAKNLDMTVMEKSKEMASASIKAKKDDEDYWIKMEEKAKKRTTTSVRVGVLGDNEASQKIKKK